MQGDLRQLREKLVVGNDSISVTELDKALAETEEGLQVIIIFSLFVCFLFFFISKICFFSLGPGVI